MKKLSNSVLFTIFSLILINLSFSSCANDVVDITTVSGPNETQCGGFSWQVKFKLQDTHPRAGWLVQEINVVQVVTNCNGTPNSTFSTHFWEAWHIPANGDHPSLRDALGLTYDDMYQMPDRGRTFGFTNAVGKIKYFENVNLPATMVPNNPRTYAGILHSDTAEPPFWNTSDEEDEHTFKNEWNCCVNPPTRSYESVPVIGGIQITPNPPLRFNSKVSQTIRSIPPWTKLSGPEEANQLKEAAVGLTKVSNISLKKGIFEFIDSTQNRTDALEQASKVYVLLRAMYDVPSAIPIDQVKTYGGWLRPTTETTSEMYDLQYPLRYNEDSQELIYIGQFEGYLGSPYDAKGEFEFFNENFELREF